MTRVLVCGGRHFENVTAFEKEMQEVHEKHNVTVVIHGAASGADALARDWAMAREIEVISCPADWKTYGRKAGPMRNEYMLKVHKLDLVVAFPGGKGTADMVKRAMSAGVDVVQSEVRA